VEILTQTLFGSRRASIETKQKQTPEGEAEAREQMIDNIKIAIEDSEWSKRF
jgi:hypothetical protein